MVLAVIPARGGSKGIPRKNLALLAGRPLIEYSIEAAQRSRGVDEILLSTDDEEIAEVGRRLGVSVPYRRPAELAGDRTSMVDALEHGLRWYSAHRSTPDDVLLLQPTSPLRTAADIEGALALYRESRAKSLASVQAMGEHPSECVFRRAGAAPWEYVAAPPAGVVRRQDYQQEFYFINGAIYLVEMATLLARRTFVDLHDTAFYVMPRERGLDIDNPIDLVVAEALMRA